MTSVAASRREIGHRTLGANIVRLDSLSQHPYGPMIMISGYWHLRCSIRVPRFAPWQHSIRGNGLSSRRQALYTGRVHGHQEAGFPRILSCGRNCPRIPLPCFIRQIQGRVGTKTWEESAKSKRKSSGKRLENRMATAQIIYLDKDLATNGNITSGGVYGHNAYTEVLCIGDVHHSHMRLNET